LGVKSEYQDFVQDVFTQLFGHLSALKDPHAFPGYFRQIVLTVAISDRRKNADHKQVELDDLVAVATEVDNDILTKLFIRSYLERLSVREQTVIWLSFFEEYSMKQIAEQLG